MEYISPEAATVKWEIMPGLMVCNYKGHSIKMVCRSTHGASWEVSINGKFLIELFNTPTSEIMIQALNYVEKL